MGSSPASAKKSAKPAKPAACSSHPPSSAKTDWQTASLADSGGTLCATYRQVSPNPDIRECDDCIRLIHENHCDFIVALGGGSVLDCAKAAAAFSNGNHPAGAYLDGTLPVPARGLPLIAIPTTAGTGSEVSRVTVLSDHAKGIKAPSFSPAFYPVCAIIDPELTRTLPKAVTACTGMDVLCHAIEAYWSIHHQPICDALAIHAARLVMHHLETACENPRDMHAREKMAEASVTAGLAFARPGTTAAHACSYPLTSILGIPHGEACGLTIDHFMRINAKADTDGRLALLAEATGFSDIANLADAIAELKYRTGLKTDLSACNLSDSQIETLVAASRQAPLYNNPVPITDDMLRTLYPKPALTTAGRHPAPGTDRPHHRPAKPDTPRHPRTKKSAATAAPQTTRNTPHPARPHPAHRSRIAAGNPRHPRAYAVTADRHRHTLRSVRITDRRHHDIVLHIPTVGAAYIGY